MPIPQSALGHHASGSVLGDSTPLEARGGVTGKWQSLLVSSPQPCTPRIAKKSVSGQQGSSNTIKTVP